MLQLLVAFILFAEASLNAPSVFVRGRIVNRSCPDEDLAILCDGHCYTDYLACKADCDSSSCERTCLTSYTSCYSSCPCFDDCPNGCDGCPNSICTCQEPQKNNSYYRQCIDEATDELKSCIMDSPADKGSYELCFDEFMEASEKCPCNSGCQTGCPCENGFKCQENIMAMCQVEKSSSHANFTYVISADGLYKENRHYLSPQSSGPSSYYPFLRSAGSALLNGEIFLFGGAHDDKKIGKLDSCEIVDTGKRLLLSFSTSGSVVTVPEVHDEIVICRGSSSACETFDGQISVQITSTKTSHQYACMALFRNQATIIAGYTAATVETLAVSGWTPEPSHPSGSANGKFYHHACVSIDDGIITTGGYDGSTWLKSVYFFQNEEWKNVGELSNTYQHSSMIAVQEAFLVFGGFGRSTLVERAEWDGKNVISTRNLTDNGGKCFKPILFHTRFDTCKDFCSENFCYN